MSKSDIVGYLAAVLVFITFWMKTMVPLRTLGIGSNIFFIAYGYLAAAYPPLVLHVLLLPLNLWRLREMVLLSRRVERAAAGDLNMAWIKPFTSTLQVKTGDILFRKGHTADRLFIVVSGRYCLAESGIEIPVSAVVGELGLLSDDKKRTQTLECLESGELLEITYEQVRQLYFQNPTFGFYFLQLASKRLFENIQRLEAEVASLRTRSAPPSDVTTRTLQA